MSRSWAIGLTQKQFEEEWIKKFPSYDHSIIPNVKNWTRNINTENRGIDGFNPESLESSIDDYPPVKKTVEKDIEEKIKKAVKKEDKRYKRNQQKYVCPVCSREIIGRVGFIMHLKKCKKVNG